jgi:hypothetical protein
VVERGLAVRQRGGDAVHQHAHAAHAELRARAQPADGDALAQRVVEAVVHLHARHGRQRVRERQPRACLTDLLLLDDGYGKRRPQDRSRRAEHLHRDGVQRDDAHGVLRVQRRRCNEEQAAQHPGGGRAS